MANPVEAWKAEMHGFDVWPDFLSYAANKTPMNHIPAADLERLKWHGVFYRKRDNPQSYMLRIRLPGGEFTAEQARAIAFVAYEFGYGIADVTTRANIQVQGLAIENVPKAIERLQSVGLDLRQTGHDNIRNVFGHPLSGVDPEELIDTRRLCRDLTHLFLGNRKYADLPRKFNIALCGRATATVHYWTQDLSYVAHRRGDEVGFLAIIGGKQGQSPIMGKPLPFWIRAGQVVDLARVLLDLFRERGRRDKRDRARFPYLVESLGIDAVGAFVQEHMPEPLTRTDQRPEPPTGYEDLVGWIPQKQPGRWAMGLCIPLGRLGWQQLEGVAVASKNWGDGTLRATVEQGLIVPNVPAGFKDALATAVSRLRLEFYADSIARSVVACTGKQFCNIAVTETKGHAYRLIAELRQRSMQLHGIRIHLSGCPSSCAMHYSADIGLKGVRVRRLLGSKEGFDVFLAGGVSGGIHLGIPYRLGVDVDQLPQLVEEVVEDYYLHHQPGQTFSDYWRAKLRDRDASKVGEAEYQVPTWECENCGHSHRGEDPPIFCPKCAALRRHFVRLDPIDGDAPASQPPATPPAPTGYTFAVKASALSDKAGACVEVDGREVALFRIGEQVTALDNQCPHQGGPLTEGELVDGVVTCPWHGWKFDACTGCGVDPADQRVPTRGVIVQDGNVFVERLHDADPVRPRPVESALLTVREVVDESPDVKTLRLDNASGVFPLHSPGQFLRVAVAIDGTEHVRSFTISSSPTRPEVLEITVKCGPRGLVSKCLHERIRPGDQLAVSGPFGTFCYDAKTHVEPIVLIAAGSGVTPMRSILRTLAATEPDHPCTLIQGARTPADVLFDRESADLVRSNPKLQRFVTLTQPDASWTRDAGRIDLAYISKCVLQPALCRYFLCGPDRFMEELRAGLMSLGVPSDRLHMEDFQSRPAAVTAS